MARTLSIIVVERDRDRAMMIVDGLREAGDYTVMVIAEEAGLARRSTERKPDVVLIDVANPSRDVLEELTLATTPMDRSDGTLTRAAIEAGVSAYVVDGIRAERIQPVLDAAIARFHMVAKMRAELAATKKALEERKAIDRAKGILMRAKGLGEQEDDALIRRTAMDQGRKVADVAAALVTAADMLR